jgi:hypothetical protein
MKHFFLRSSAVLACALGLASCGGGNSGQLQIGVTLVNVTKTGLQLQNNGGAFHDVPAGGFYAFPELIPIDGSFDVVAQGKPANTTKCEVQNGKAKATNISLQKIRVVCTLITYNLGGTISGLTGPVGGEPADTGSGLILANGTDQKTIPVGAASFDMTLNAGTATESGKVPEGAPYGIVIFKQPVGRSCAVNPASSATGTMPAGDVTSVSISCS